MGYRFLLLAALCVPLPATAATVTVTEEECANYTAHTPDPSVEYRPGSSSDGRTVAPADLPGGGVRVTPPENFAIDINVELQERFGIPPNAEQYMGEARIGTVEIRDGRAFFNGQELATGDQHAVLDACRRLQEKR